LYGNVPVLSPGWPTLYQHPPAPEALSPFGGAELEEGTVPHVEQSTDTAQLVGHDLRDVPVVRESGLGLGVTIVAGEPAGVRLDAALQPLRHGRPN
jgi:hypothetical protein